MNNSVDRAVEAVCQDMQGRLALVLRIGNVQLRIQVAFRYMVDVGDVGYGHPGTNGTHIACERQAAVLLKAFKGLDRLDRAKDH